MDRWQVDRWQVDRWQLDSITETPFAVSCPHRNLVNKNLKHIAYFQSCLNSLPIMMTQLDDDLQTEPKTCALH